MRGGIETKLKPAWRILAVILLVFLSALGAMTYVFLNPPTRSFKPLGTATEIKVYDRNGVKVADIHDPKRIVLIREFVNRYRSGWGGSSDMMGVPIPSMKANFLNGQAFIGHFGAGPGFFETQRDGDFASLRVADNDRKAFQELLGLR